MQPDKGLRVWPSAQQRGVALRMIKRRNKVLKEEETSRARSGKDTESTLCDWPSRCLATMLSM